ncbi:MAG: aromatic amino acid ammonia-lyase [Bifidobacteriaceae bacterium]|jgi:histidine ammonia-lyase|nr:aromatic amino acid ammonia-lyase [Bifidobacteriaceae bacterium]
MLTLNRPLTVADIDAIANRGEPVALPPAVLAALAERHQLSQAVAASQPVYGQTTGVGANKSTAVDPADGAHGLRLLRSHAVEAGPALPRPVVRAMLAVRLAQLAVPGAGLDPAVVEGLAAMLNQDALPTVRRFGGIGTADLGALAGVGLALVGERPTDPPLAQPLASLRASDALPLMSSSALTLGQVALSLARLDALAGASEVVFALVAAATQANPQHWSPAAVGAAATPAAEQVAARLVALLGEPGPDGPPPPRIQERYGLRAYLLTQAMVRHRQAELTDVVERLINTAQENPLFVPDAAAPGGGRAVHHAAFFHTQVAQALDAANLALAATVPLALGRLAHLNEPALTGLGVFLSEGPAGSSGLMIVEYLAAAAGAEMRASANPVAAGTAILSRGAEEDATFAPQGAYQLERSLEAWSVMLACELVAGVRLTRLARRAEALPPALAKVWPAIAHLDTVDGDHDLTPLLAAAGELWPQLAAV